MWGKDKTKKVDFDRHAGKTTMIAKGTVIDGDVRFDISPQKPKNHEAFSPKCSKHNRF